VTVPPGASDLAPGRSTTDVERLDDVEALLWSLEHQDPLYRSNIVVVGVLDRVPGATAVIDRFERLTRLVPRLRDRVVTAELPQSVPWWEPDPEFDLAYHLRWVHVTGEGTVDDLLRLAEPLASEGLDPARPLWQAVIVEGLASGGAGLILKLHHTLSDGMGLVEIAARLLDVERHPTDHPELPGLTLHAQRGPLERLRDDVVAELSRGTSWARQAVDVVATGLSDLRRDPERRMHQSFDLACSAGRLSVPSSAPLSPLMTGRSLSSRLDVVDFALDDVVAAARDTGGTVNDVYVAGVLDGLRRYHAKHGSWPVALRVGIPVSRRASHHAEPHGAVPHGAEPYGAQRNQAGGNQFVPLRLVAPAQIDERVPRVQAIRHLIQLERRQPALGLLDVAAALIGHLPAAQAVVGMVLGSVDVMASNVIGSPIPLYLGGALVERMIPFGPRAGAGLNVTVVSYAGRFTVGMHLDRAATPDVELLSACLRDGLSSTVGAA
jgi:WS/DGAT/MGAT family acyltransferase